MAKVPRKIYKSGKSTLVEYGQRTSDMLLFCSFDFGIFFNPVAFITGVIAVVEVFVGTLAVGGVAHTEVGYKKDCSIVERVGSSSSVASEASSSWTSPLECCLVGVATSSSAAALGAVRNCDVSGKEGLC